MKVAVLAVLLVGAIVALSLLLSSTSDIPRPSESESARRRSSEEVAEIREDYGHLQKASYEDYVRRRGNLTALCLEGNPTRQKDDLVKQRQLNRLICYHPYMASGGGVVMDVGAYTGHLAKRFTTHFGVQYYAFEPIRKHFEVLSRDFSDDPRVHAFNFGLGAEDATVQFSLSGVSSSQYDLPPDAERETVQIRNVTEVVRTLLPDVPIDLLIINCEGCEYSLLEEMIRSGVERRFRNIQVQKHLLDGVPDLRGRWCRIEASLLGEGYRLAYRVPWVWERWEWFPAPPPLIPTWAAVKRKTLELERLASGQHC